MNLGEMSPIITKKTDGSKRKTTNKTNNMKNFTKLFVLASALFALACTTDTTEDLGLGLAGQTKVSLSLEEATKTYLGEKADNLYPLYWSEGDQISVNGVTSVALTEGGSANATFTFNGTLEYPYSVIYPAAANGASEVVFPASQEYTAGTFSAGAAPMYGYAENSASAIQLHHLTGVLRFAITGDATLSSVVLTAESGSLSGTYAVDCATGTLTPVKGSTSNSVTLTFGEGLALGTEPTPIYVAVPAGEYGSVLVTIYTVSGEKMVARFDTSAKAIAGGKVREFGEFQFSGVASDEFIIDGVDALVKFAANPSKSARVTANIDMTGVEWTPIEGFALTFDGGNFEIKGLTAPLFGATSGSFQNVKLTDINIVETENPTVGALARTIVAVDSKAPIVSNCSVSGKLTVNVKNFAPTVKETPTDAAMGALVGYAIGVDISDCVNEAVVDIQSVVSTSTSVTVVTCGGGIVGYAKGEVNLAVVGGIRNCENKASVTYTNGSYASTFGISNRTGGIAGQVDTCVVLKKLTNRGAISANGTFHSTFTNNVAGLIGLTSKNELEESNNYGAVSFTAGRFGVAQLAGLVAYSTNSAVTNCHNYGPITMASGVTHHDLICGGILARHTGTELPDFSIVSNCSNNAPVSILSDMEGKSSDEQFRVGGAIAWDHSSSTNVTNNAEGVLTVKSKLYNADDTVYCIAIGGCVAYWTQTCSPTGITNHAPVNVDCTLTTSSSYTAFDKVRLNVGGAIGYFNINDEIMSSVTNTGSVTVKANSVGDIRIGGVCGQDADGVLDGGINSGDITLEAGSKAGNLLEVGGVAACTAGDAVKNIENSGNVTIEEDLDVAKACYVAGGVAWTSKSITTLKNSGNVLIKGGICGSNASSNDSKILNVGGGVGWVNAKVTMDGIINSGSVTVQKFTSNYTFSVAGCVARISGDTGGTCKNSKNTGAISVDDKCVSKGGFYVGGVLGIGNKTGTGSLSYCENDAPITAKASAANGNVYIGGVAGYVDLGGSNADLKNGANGDILVQLANTSTSDEFCVGGVAGRMVDHCVPVENYGDVTIKGKIKYLARVAGLVAYPNNYNRRNLTNDCTITIDAEIGNILTVGGLMAGGSYGGIYTNAHSRGRIHITKNAIIHADVHIGGLIGNNTNANVVINGCSNSTDILFEGQSGADAGATMLSIGGMIGRSTALRSVQRDFTNSGNITFTGKHSGTGELAIGGIYGHNETPLIGSAFAVYGENGTEISTEATRPSGPIYHECKVTNIGKITCTGTYAGPAYVGGLAGSSTTGFCNGMAFCEVEALDYPNVGMLTGSAYSTEEATAFTNCHAGGQVTVKSYFDEDKDDYVPQTNALSKDNYRLYIFGSSITSEEAQANKLGFISSIDATPVYSTGAAVE